MPWVLIQTHSCFLTSRLLHFTFSFGLCVVIHIHMYHSDANTDSFCLQQLISIYCNNQTSITPIRGYLPSIHTVVFLYSFYRHMSLHFPAPLTQSVGKTGILSLSKLCKFVEWERSDRSLLLCCDWTKQIITKASGTEKNSYLAPDPESRARRPSGIITCLWMPLLGLRTFRL